MLLHCQIKFGNNLITPNSMKEYHYFKQLDDSEKSTFLQIITNTILIIITFWLGLSMSLIITDNSVKSREMLTNMEYVDKFLPYKESLAQLIKFNGLNNELNVLMNTDKKKNKNNFSDDIIEKATIKINEYCSDSLFRQTIINDFDKLIDIFSYIKYFVPKKDREDFNKNLNDGYSMTQFMKASNYPDFDILEEMNSVRAVMINDITMPITKKDLNNLGYDDIIKKNDNFQYCFIEATKKILHLYNTFIKTFNPSDNYGFLNNPQIKDSLLLLFLTLVSLGIIGRIMMKKTLEKHVSVSQAKYNKSEKERTNLETHITNLETHITNLKTHITSLESDLKALNSIYDDLKDKNDDLNCRYIEALKEIGQLRGNKKNRKTNKKQEQTGE